MKEDLEDGTLSSRPYRKFKYDVVLSFAGEDREYVESVARCLKERQLRIFYDKYGEVESWGKDLYVHLDNVYRKKARYCVMFISKYYKKKLWANRERESAQARAFKENSEYILPARFDNSKIPGLLPTVGYISLSNRKPSKFAELIIEKVGLPILKIPKKFLPETPNKLYKFVGATTKKDKEIIKQIASKLLEQLSLLKKKELIFIYYIFLYGCPVDLPENIHINLEYFSRIASLTKKQIQKIIENLDTLGFETKIKERTSHYTFAGCKKAKKSYLLVMKVYDYSIESPLANVTGILNFMLHFLQEYYCEEHALKMFLLLNFSILE